MGTPSHLGHMDRVAATMSFQAHAGAAQEAPDIGQWEGQDVPLLRPSSCIVKGGIPSIRRYLPYLSPGRSGSSLSCSSEFRLENAQISCKVSHRKRGTRTPHKSVNTNFWILFEVISSPFH